jgi:hypothetical protein
MLPIGHFLTLVNYNCFVAFPGAVMLRSPPIFRRTFRPASPSCRPQLSTGPRVIRSVRRGFSVFRWGWWWLPAVALALQPVAGQEVRETPRDASFRSAAPLNLHLVIREDLVNRLAARDEVQPGPVEDVFEDTLIRGHQVTATRLRIDLRPSESEGRFAFVLEGATSSLTSGLSPQAIVKSVGCQKFVATKEVLFDGFQLATRHAVVSVRADHQNIGAVTPLTGRPLGPLAEQVVLSVAQHRQPAAEAFARQRVIERVYPQFDAEIDRQLANVNRLLKETLQTRLRSARLMPDRVCLRTTQRHLHLAASIAAPLAEGMLRPAPAQLIAEHGITAYLHESLLQGIVDRANLAGRTTTNRDVMRLLALTGLTDEFEPTGLLAELDVEIEFVDVDPLLIRIGDDETRIVVRARFKAASQELLPPLEITIPCRLEATEDAWLVKTGPIQVRTTEGTSDGTSLAEVAVKRMIETSLPKLSFPRKLPADLVPEGRAAPQVSSIRSGQGWLVIGVD